ncbi:hypothetical protein K443DRAFT_123572 [Laccaria amethystina LaAM-08-1]|uniref:Uncharacterized protein n=1 Tax=Laccaria amethystina LaAM-08-1 TaxID=1095629 RepID=A0A0C9XRQ1_9AGAR|nr:hypothetical protein K443DRAFT_123572 [Laccaria amethystina LaAM-08-1]
MLTGGVTYDGSFAREHQPLKSIGKKKSTQGRAASNLAYRTVAALNGDESRRWERRGGRSMGTEQKEEEGEAAERRAREEGRDREEEGLDKETEGEREAGA